MAAASTTLGNLGRGVAFANLSAISINLTLTATVYSSAGGGIPFDLTSALQQAASGELSGGAAGTALNPADIVGIIPVGLSTAGFVPASLVVGTATFTTPSGMSAGNASATPGILATCPCTMRLWGTGAANAAHLAEIADGAVTDTVTFLLLINRSGANN
jgi:hypothetical protein